MNGSSGHLPKLAKNTDILVAHNAIPQQASTGEKWLHMTPQKIGEIAQQAQVKKLMLSHFMLRTINKKQESKQFIRKSYQGKIVEAKELQFMDL
jgi:ribonuclease BN (tRNA processing enzyme)